HVPDRKPGEAEGDQREEDIAGVVEDPHRDLAGEVAEDADRDRPRDAAESIPGEEARPGHVVRAREPGGGDAQEREPAAEEDRLAAVALEERLTALEKRLAPVFEPARPREHAS